jgi:hypothetical protein
MAMPLCGTFKYTGVVPDTKADRESGQWQVHDTSGASSRTGDPLWDNRLIGLKPTLRILGSHVVLEAPSRHRSEIHSASLELDTSLLDSFQGGDFFTLARTSAAEIGIALLRGGRLMVAVGAVIGMPLGDRVAVRRGRVVDYLSNDPRQSLCCDSWVDVAVSGENGRLRRGEEATLGNYRLSVVRCFEDGDPGSYECLAITLEGICPHEATMHSAGLLARPNAGLIMSKWS